MIPYKKVGSILNKHKKRDNWFLDDYSINPFDGCGFNCNYCYVHGSKYGENLSEKMMIKADAESILDKQLSLRVRKKQYGYIAVGSATDAYMQAESETGLTTALLKIICKHRFPVFISTKSALISKDFELLKEIDEVAILPEDLKDNPGRGVIIAYSFSTLDERLAKRLESGAPSPQKRLEALKICSDEGFLCGMNAMPLLPFISDTEEHLELIISSAKDAMANFILVAGLTLFGNNPGDNKQLYFRFLKENFPELLQQYEKMYGKVGYPSREYQDQLKKRADRICKKYNMRTSIR